MSKDSKQTERQIYFQILVGILKVKRREANKKKLNIKNNNNKPHKKSNHKNYVVWLTVPVLTQKPLLFHFKYQSKRNIYFSVIPAWNANWNADLLLMGLSEHIFLEKVQLFQQRMLLRTEIKYSLPTDVFTVQYKLIYSTNNKQLVMSNLS